MSERGFRLCRAVIGVVLGGLVGWSVATGNAVLPVIAAAVAIGIRFICQKRVRAVINDERNYRISEKAARLTISILGPAMAVAAAVLVALSKNSPSGLRLVGLTLAYSACAIVLLHTVLYAYFERKIG
ncbi:MAG: DUF2178 domain-containing protein [Chloroflexota bacterium]